MAKISLVDIKNKSVGEIELDDSVFGVKVNVPLIHQVIKAQLADRRQGTAKTKTKSEVRGGGKKPFKQKGTGNARQGSIRSPLNKGGGQNFGPQPRSYAQRTPKEMVRGALRSALTDRVNAKRLIVVDEFNLAKINTKSFSKTINEAFKIQKSLIIDTENKNLELSARNLKGVRVLRTEGINVYDIIKHDWLVLTKNALATISKRLAD